MTKGKLLLLLLPFLVAGCVQAISMRDIDRRDNIPSVSYEAYFFAGGMSEKLRAVFLKRPDAGVNVEPYSDNITGTTATYGEAMYFMRERKGTRTIVTQVVSYKDRPIGYLLTYNRPGMDPDRADITLTERNGVVYFSAREIIHSDD